MFPQGIMSVTPVTMRLGHCCSALPCSCRPIKSQQHGNLLLLHKAPRLAPRLLTIQSLKTKDCFKQCLWSSIKWGMWYRQQCLLVGPITAPHLQKVIQKRRGGQSARQLSNRLQKVQQSVQYYIVGLCILDTGSTLLYNFFTSYMSDKVLCQMTVFIYTAFMLFSLKSMNNWF